MITAAARLVFHAPFAHSLKEKRRVVGSIISRTRAKFNISISEVARQDAHQFIVIGISCVSQTARQCERVLTAAISFAESITEAQLIEITREM